MPSARPPVILKANGLHMLTPAGTHELVPLTAIFARLNTLRTFRYGGEKELTALAFRKEMELMQLENCLTRGVLGEKAAAYKLMLVLGPPLETVVSMAAARPSCSDVLDEDETDDLLRELKAVRAMREAEPESCSEKTLLAPEETAEETHEETHAHRTLEHETTEQLQAPEPPPRKCRPTSGPPSTIPHTARLNGTERSALP